MYCFTTVLFNYIDSIVIHGFIPLEQTGNRPDNPCKSVDNVHQNPSDQSEKRFKTSTQIGSTVRIPDNATDDEKNDQDDDKNLDKL